MLNGCGKERIKGLFMTLDPRHKSGRTLNGDEESDGVTHRGHCPVYNTRDGMCIAQLSLIPPKMFKLTRNCPVCRGVTKAEMHFAYLQWVLKCGYLAII